MKFLFIGIQRFDHSSTPICTAECRLLTQLVCRCFCLQPLWELTLEFTAYVTSVFWGVSLPIKWFWGWHQLELTTNFALLRAISSMQYFSTLSISSMIFANSSMGSSYNIVPEFIYLQACKFLFFRRGWYRRITHGILPCLLHIINYGTSLHYHTKVVLVLYL